MKIIIVVDPPHGHRTEKELTALGHEVTCVQDQRGHAVQAIHPDTEWVIAMLIHSAPGVIEEKARNVGARWVRSSLGWSHVLEALKASGFPFGPQLALVPEPPSVVVPAEEPERTNVGTSAIAPYVFDGREVRIQVDEVGEPWFCAADVCACLGLDNARQAVAPLEADEKGVRIADTPGGPQQMQHVTEAGLYQLVMVSRRPEAKVFRRWVTHEVLPSIRKTGGYSMVPQPESRAQIMARALIAANEELTETRQALALSEARVTEQAKQIEEAAPKVEGFDHLLDTSNACCITEGMKAIGRKPNKGHAWLESEGHIYRRGKSVLARQDHLDAGRMVQRSVTVGDERITQTRLTAKGLAYLDTRMPREFPEAA